MKTTEELEKYWNGKAQFVLKGKTIVDVFYMSADDADNHFGWYKRPVVMRLNDGTELILSADDEGNEGGSLFYATGDESDGVLPTL
jgi:hypothetical protein